MATDHLDRLPKPVQAIAAILLLPLAIVWHVGAYLARGIGVFLVFLAPLVLLALMFHWAGST